MGWEYRYFVPLSRQHAAILSQPREDVYFPCDSSTGMKLRDGDGSELEVKQLVAFEEIGSFGSVEKWKKVILPGRELVTRSGEDDWKLANTETLVRALPTPCGEVWRDYPEGRQPPVRVYVGKTRTRKDFGEVTDVVLRARLDGRRDVVLEEFYRSYCIEIGEPSKVRSKLTTDASLQPPADAFRGGFPALVAQFALRALAADGGTSSRAAEEEPQPLLQDQADDADASADAEESPSKLKQRGEQPSNEEDRTAGGRGG